VIVAAPSDDAAEEAIRLAAALGRLALAPSLAVANRTLPPGLSLSPARVASSPPPARAFAQYVRNQLRAQARVRSRLASAFPRLIDLPEAAALDSPARLDRLAALGAPLRAALRTPATPGARREAAR